MARTLDLNCDMGESFGAWVMGDDAAMLDLVSSANIACGFHAGDPSVMRRTIRMARDKGVSVGAHPSFADLYGFGRRRISGENPDDLEAQLIYQIVAMRGMCAVEGHAMTHVKTHGALGNMAAVDPDLAALCVGAVKAVDPGLIYVSLPYSETMLAAERIGLRTACEIYADRSYTDGGELTPRSQPGAVIHDPNQSLDQVLEMVVNGHIPTTGGKRLPVDPATLCVHGDTPGAVEILRKLRQSLIENGVEIAPFAKP
ncbi:LamB/YcsF family protein [Paracoccus aminophilus]|uniref:5-oxoprolinase subunit A n=1 Tax=Paracoccus aminophilus JCM 7686 TaxID=1367847 RepID=S5YAU4_PARAH|nr:5-oxoprolinase subunit PxpA [Paracoccus aminophilus]AGT08538.1 LamB/YcsF family protein [Paracoccus aminophilus JCM 7686]